MERLESMNGKVGTTSTRKLSQQEVVESIRRAILANELGPGQRLVESDLCAALGSSRGTVRAALAELAHEGLIEHIANRGARVRVVSLDEALQIVDVRLAVESLCVARTAEIISEKEIRELQRMSDRLPALAESGDVTGFAQQTHEIFQTYVRISNLTVAQETLERLRDRLTGNRLRLTYRSGRAQVSLPYWQAIVAAICRREPTAAQEALKKHVANIKENMKALSQEQSVLAGLGRVE